MSENPLVPAMTPARLFAIDHRSLALFRMALAAWIVVAVALRLPDLGVFYADTGLLPGASVLTHTPPALSVWSLYLVGGSVGIQTAVALAQIACAILLFFGWRTRLMAFASWLFLVSLEARNPLVCAGFDTLAQLLAFWAMWVPLGAALSVDRALAGTAPQEESTFSPGSIALLAQVSLLYVFAGLHKYQAPAWRDGTALVNALTTPELAHAPGLALSRFPAVLGPMTQSVVWFEMLGPLALFSPVAFVRVRLATIALFVVLQVGFGACLAVGLFPFISTAAMALFLPPEFWQRFPGLERLLERVATAPARLFRRGSAPEWSLGRGQRALVAALTLYVACWNFATLRPEFLARTGRRFVPQEGRGYRPPHPLCWIGLSLRLNQAMTMFLEPDGAAEWSEVRVRTATGTRTWYLDGARLSETPVDASGRFGVLSLRYGNFFGALPAYPWAHTHVGAYLCRRFRAEHPGERPLELRLYRVHQPAAAPLKRYLVLAHLCQVEDGELEP